MGIRDDVGSAEGIRSLVAVSRVTTARQVEESFPSSAATGRATSPAIAVPTASQGFKDGDLILGKGRIGCRNQSIRGDQ